jgi:hypothetical protein
VNSSTVETDSDELHFPPRRLRARRERTVGWFEETTPSAADLLLVYGVADPLVFRVVELLDVYRELALLGKISYEDGRGKDGAHHKLRLYAELERVSGDLSVKVDGWLVRFNRSPNEGLVALVDQIETTPELQFHVLAAMEKAAAELGAEQKKYEYLLDEARLILNELHSAVASLTHEQLSLQMHLQYLVTAAMPPAYDAELLKARDLFLSLFILRDEYFTEPRPGLLREYLAETAKIEVSAAYRALDQDVKAARSKLHSFVYGLNNGLDNLPAKLEAAAEELEVLALLDEVDLANGDTHAA